MWFKLINENGEYIDNKILEDRNLIYAQMSVFTPDGQKDEWIELDTIEAAEIHFNISKKIINDILNT